MAIKRAFEIIFFCLIKRNNHTHAVFFARPIKAAFKKVGEEYMRLNSPMISMS